MAVADIATTVALASEAERRFRGAFDHAPIGMAIVGPDGRWLDVNPALCRIVGYAPTELIGSTRSAVTHPDDLSRNDELLGQILSGQSDAFEMEKRYIHKTGYPVWVHLSVSAIREPGGALSYVIAQIQDISERRRHQEQLEHLVDHDGLTGLLNRRGFDRVLDRHMRELRDREPEGALLLLDLDRFKYINDSLGHRAGDELIVAVARLLSAELRGGDVVARLGGDEFAILLRRADATEAVAVAGRIGEAIRTDIPGERTRGLPVTVSVGIAVIDTATAEPGHILIDADLAMYDAKEAGRNRVEIAEGVERGPSRMRTRLTWMERINGALQRDGFELHAQPILDISSGRVRHHELLLRMRADDGTLIPPLSFLDVAERFDLVQEIDRWVVRRACRIAAEEQRSGRDATFAVNLSAKSIGDPHLLTTIEEEIERTGVCPNRLIFEITETAAVTDMPAAKRLTERLHELGCQIALDDFGAGFGAFAYLKHLPLDFIKIDGEFVKGCVSSHADQVIIDGVVRMASGLGKQTIAEFTGDEETLDLLRARGVDFAQGFFVGKPVPLSEALGR